MVASEFNRRINAVKTLKGMIISENAMSEVPRTPRSKSSRKATRNIRNERRQEVFIAIKMVITIIQSNESAKRAWDKVLDQLEIVGKDKRKKETWPNHVAPTERNSPLRQNYIDVSGLLETN